MCHYQLSSQGTDMAEPRSRCARCEHWTMRCSEDAVTRSITTLIDTCVRATCSGDSNELPGRRLSNVVQPAGLEIGSARPAPPITMMLC